MKKLFLSLMLLSVSGISNAMEKIKLPSRQVLRDRLCAQGLDYFMEKTRIDEKLGDKEMHPSDVVITIATAFYDFDNRIMDMGRQPMIATAMHDQKPETIKLVYDHFGEVKNLIRICQIKLEL